jgi:hypothetical protein
MSSVLFAALHAVRSSFRELLGSGLPESIAIELDYEAGKRFECWLALNPPDELRYRHNDWGRDVNPDSERPMREIYLQGVTIRWPLKLIKLPSGRVIPEPLPDVVGTIEHGEVRTGRPNLKHPKELAKLLTEGGAPELMHRWQCIDTDHDIPDLAGYNVAGTVRYVDRDAFHALHDPGHAIHILGEAIDTGLSPEDTIACIIEHEGDEKVILDADNNIDHYPDAHEFATTGENEKVIAKGSTPLRYNRGLRKIIKFCERKNPIKVPHDLCCAPYLDDPDANDRRVLRIFQHLGVVDAFKLGKRAVEYGRAADADHCSVCKGWMGRPQMDLSPCHKVEGLVRLDRWCKEYSGRGGSGGAPAPSASTVSSHRFDGGSTTAWAATTGRPGTRPTRPSAGSRKGNQCLSRSNPVATKENYTGRWESRRGRKSRRPSWKRQPTRLIARSATTPSGPRP